MIFSMWLAERNQRDATKKHKAKTNLEIHQRVVSAAAHKMKHGKAGPMASDNLKPDRKAGRGEGKRDAIRRSESGD
jgi:hypothetical protein